MFCPHNIDTACHQNGGHCTVQVVAGINQRLQELVAQAQQLAASGDSSDQAATLLALHTGISKLGAVQQSDVVANIAEVATRFAADPSYDASAEITSFSQVRFDGRCCHSDIFADAP